MRDKIINKLKEIELEENIEIIFACESGSRAWGFASPDSDYDVRFIYKRNRKDYLNLNEARDVIEWELNDVYDINGWDLKKALRLSHSSNPTLLEWCNSSILYVSNHQFESFCSITKEYFSSKKCLMHYISMAETTFKTHLSKDEVALKKYFYALRPLFAANWIVERNEFPPIEFDILLENYCPINLKPTVNELIDQKMSSDESAFIPGLEEINKYIKEEIIRLKDISKDIEFEDKDWSQLNEFFIKTIG